MYTSLPKEGSAEKIKGGGKRGGWTDKKTDTYISGLFALRHPGESPGVEGGMG